VLELLYHNVIGIFISS